MDQSLQKIAALVKVKQYERARTLLHEYVEQHPRQAYAWYLLSFAEDNASDRFVAAWQAAELAPKNARIKARLKQLQWPRSRSRLPLLVALLVGVVIIGLALFLALSPGARSSPAVPTLAVLPSLQATMDNVVMAASPGGTSFDATAERETPVTAEVISTLTESGAEITDMATAAQSGAATAETQAAGVPALPTAVPSQASPLPTAITQPEETLAPPATLNPTATATFAGPSPTPIAGAAPLNSPLNIGGGEMRVVAATRPGDALIREVGGSAPNPPAGQKWLLVELLLVCASDGNCAPDASALSVLGTSGTVYTPAAGLRIEPLFGSDAYMTGQVWGYVGFTVSDSETALYLSVTRDRRQYLFALQ